ncbi:hypothetical protein [Anaerofustis stercorihominis]|uniref:hypothetical protein n=1 Tax=Anaerofustis stercorihominis TaxID=214853 RepID=UPI0026736067|nr:hypothetical protein [Anaerofustis stercorihominis]
MQDFRDLTKSSHPLSYIFKRFLKAYRNDKGITLNRVDVRELIIYLDKLERENAELGKYKIRSLADKAVEENRVYKITTIDRDNGEIISDKTVNYKGLFGILIEKFSNDDIKQFERDLLIDGYIFAERGKETISIAQSVLKGGKYG